MFIVFSSHEWMKAHPLLRLTLAHTLALHSLLQLRTQCHFTFVLSSQEKH